MAEGVYGIIKFAFLEIDCAEVAVDFGYIGQEIREFSEGCFSLIQASGGKRLPALLGQQFFAGLRGAIRLSSQRSSRGCNEYGQREQIRE